jgi:hypothetical protein
MDNRFLRFAKLDPAHTWQRAARSERFLMIESNSSTPVGEVRSIVMPLCVSVPSFIINLDSNIVAVLLSSIAHSLKADFTVPFLSMQSSTGQSSPCRARLPRDGEGLSRSTW